MTTIIKNREKEVEVLPGCCSSMQTCKYMKRSNPAMPNTSTDRKTCLGFMTNSEGCISPYF